MDAVQIPDVVIRMERWISEHTGCHFVVVTGMHGVVEARHDPLFRQVLMWADLVVPDGMPLVWIGRRKGYAMKHRVCGPELMLTFCRTTGSKYRHFFYGGAPGVPDCLADILQRRYGIRVVGTHSPPFRPPTATERRDTITRIQESRTDVLWVGLGTPKQELWIHRVRDRIRPAVAIGVGAALDFVAGHARRAPAWMSRAGLEWLFRLAHEPRRLARRYLLRDPRFLLVLGRTLRAPRSSRVCAR